MQRRSPPARAVELRTWRPSGDDALSGLRADIRTALDDYGVVARPDLASAVVLAGTELVANAWAHGRPPVAVGLLRTPSLVIVDVLDHHPSALPGPTPLRWSPVNGYGLHFVRRLAAMCGWYETYPSKHVWAAFSS